ncbi:MAG: thiol-disulfide oxidoreductase DCC family protein [Opitutales bacterium]
MKQLLRVNTNNLPVLFFDGDCGLCSRSVHFLMRRDRRRFLYFAPLQGETSAKCLPADLRQALSTAVYRRANGEILLRSDAVLQALIDISSRWRWLAHVGLKIPRRWRDGIYKWVAARRKSFFSNGACPLSSAAETKQILP